MHIIIVISMLTLLDIPDVLGAVKQSYFTHEVSCTVIESLGNYLNVQKFGCASLCTTLGKQRTQMRIYSRYTNT